MGWLSNNWIWVLLIAPFVALSLFSHGHGYGGSRRSLRPAQKAEHDGGDAPSAAPRAGESVPRDQRRQRRRGC